MDFFCSGVPEKLYYPSAGRSPDNGVVDQYNPFSAHAFLNGTQLNSYHIQP